MKLKSTLISLSLAALTLPAFAQSPAVQDPTATPRIDKRLDNQEKRIEAGEASGRLTEGEASRLETRHDNLEADVAAAKADGTVTKDERVEMHQEVNRNSRTIARQKHDGQHDFNHDGQADRPHRRHRH
jgi:septal ring factor EnvC (AmiA/AmiB activator)